MLINISNKPDLPDNINGPTVVDNFFMSVYEATMSYMSYFILGTCSVRMAETLEILKILHSLKSNANELRALAFKCSNILYP